MIVIVVWVLLSAAVAIAAKNRGRDGAAWFLLSLLLSPLIGCIFLLASKNLAQASNASFDPKIHGLCPACSEPVALTAKVCKHCHQSIADYGAVIPIERKKSLKESSAYKTFFWIVFIAVVLMVAIPAVFEHAFN